MQIQQSLNTSVTRPCERSFLCRAAFPLTLRIENDCKVKAALQVKHANTNIIANVAAIVHTYTRFNGEMVWGNQFNANNRLSARLLFCE